MTDSQPVRLRAPMSRALLLVAALVAGACGDDPPASPANEGPVAADSVAASRVEGIARRLHDRIAAGQDPEPVVREILVPLLPVLDPATERTAIERFLDAGDPVVPTTTVAGVSDALARGHLVPIGSFFATVAAKGARDAATGAALLAYTALGTTPPTTNAQGAWTAGLAAADDQVPPWLRADARTDSGEVHLTAWGLVPGWETLGVTVGTGPVLRPSDKLRLRVNRYALPRQLEVSIRSQLRWGEREGVLRAHATGLMTGRLTLDPYGPTYVAQGRDVVFNYATLDWIPDAGAACDPSFGGIGGPMPMTVRLREDAEGASGIAVRFTSDAQGELPRERFDERCDADRRDTHWFTHFWRLARREAPIPLVGTHWARPEPGVLSTNFGNAGTDAEGRWCGEWIWIELRAIP